jgi:hypothetical protein
MQLPRNSAGPKVAIAARRLRRPASVAVSLVLICALHAGCGASAPSPRAESALVAGSASGPAAGPRLAPAARLARRFAIAYARCAYLRRPPRLPGAMAAVSREVALAAQRVPPNRRRLRPRLLSLALQPEGVAALSASAEIGDGRSPPFSVGFTLERRVGRWRVVSISPPS